jgi:O-methyltransferase
MWRSYFGEKARIIGIDINPECKKFEAPGIEIIIGDQGDREFLNYVANLVPRIDILIDDGGHRMAQQVATFEVLFPHISDNGVYLCEDTHTSYLELFGGGLRKEGTFIEYAKGLADHLHAWHIPEGLLPASEYTRNIQAISFFDSIVVIEKQAHVQPWSEVRGTGIMEGKDPITPEFVEIFRTKLKLLGAGLPDYHDVGALMSSPVHLRSYLGDLFDGRIMQSPGDTMIGWQRLTQLEQCVADVLDKKIPGDFIETGVWRGGACIFMCYLLKVRGITNRKVWIADSFKGLPPPHPEHYPQDVGSTLHQIPSLAVSEEEVKVNFLKYGLQDAHTGFLKGWFHESMPHAPIEQLAILRLDGDMYQSTMEVLTALYPKLVNGGYCIIDDYGAIEACRQAVEDYRQANKINEELVTIDYTGVYWKKNVLILADET